MLKEKIAPDLVISSSIVFPYFNFSVSNDLHSSNHFPLFVSFHDFNHTYLKNLRYIYDRTNWTTFSLKAIIIPTMIEEDMNTAVALVTKSIINAAVHSIPKSTGRPGKH